MLWKRFLADDRGATAIEYGLISAIISAALLSGLGLFADNLQNEFNYFASKINY